MHRPDRCVYLSNGRRAAQGLTAGAIVLQGSEVAMHEVDETTEQMVRSVLAYSENRLRMNPVPLDKGRAARRRAVRTP